MPRPPKSPTAPAAVPAPDRTAGWYFAGLLLLMLLAYWPALSGGLLWDDNGHVTRRDLQSLAGLGRIWFEIGATQQYYPVLHSAFWLEHRWWGDSVLGYHLVNVVQHALAAGLFGLLLRRLAVPGAWLAALLFALHPVCVESVAWISDRKNTLSLVFYLAAALAYLRFDERRHARGYALASILFLLGLLTKTVTATLPAALLVVFWWRRGRLEWRRDVLPLLPWFALGAVAGLFTAHFERTLIGAEGADFNLGWADRCVLPDVFSGSTSAASRGLSTCCLSTLAGRSTPRSRASGPDLSRPRPYSAFCCTKPGGGAVPSPLPCSSPARFFRCSVFSTFTPSFFRTSPTISSISPAWPSSR